METVESRKQTWSLAKRGLAVLAAGAGLGASTDAEAGVIHTDISPDVLIFNDTYDIDLDLDSNIDFTLSHTIDGATPNFTSALLGPPTSDVIAGGAFFVNPLALPAGTPIPSGTFKNLPLEIDDQPQASKNFWRVNPNAYLGLRFDISGATHYGWAHLENQREDGLLLFGYAYCDEPGRGLRAGQTEGACLGVPLPATLALLAAGAVSALALRRREDEEG